jgi:hypothetical protein
MMTLFSNLAVLEILILLGIVVLLLNNKNADINKYTRRILGAVLFICLSPLAASAIGSLFTEGSFSSAHSGSVLWVYSYLLPYCNYALLGLIALRVVVLIKSRNPLVSDSEEF